MPRPAFKFSSASNFQTESIFASSCKNDPIASPHKPRVGFFHLRDNLFKQCFRGIRLKCSITNTGPAVANLMCLDVMRITLVSSRKAFRLFRQTKCTMTFLASLQLARTRWQFTILVCSISSSWALPTSVIKFLGSSLFCTGIIFRSTIKLRE